MRIGTSERNGHPHLRLSGRLDYLAARRLADRLKLWPASACVRLDMSQVTYLDMPAVALLLAADQELRQRGGRLVLRQLSPYVARVLRLCGVGNRRAIRLDLRRIVSLWRPTVTSPDLPAL